MAENEEDSTKTFIEDVESFLNSQDTILKWLDVIYSNYIQGNDIRDQITKLEIAYPEAYRLFAQISNLDENSTVVKKSGLSSEKLDKIFELKQRYSGLKNVIRRLVREDAGRINSWTSIVNTKSGFDFGGDIPTLEIKIFSGEKQIFHTNDNIDSISRLSQHMLNLVLTSIMECQEKKISLDSELITKIKETTLGIEEDVRNISETVEKMEKAGKRVKKINR